MLSLVRLSVCLLHSCIAFLLSDIQISIYLNCHTLSALNRFRADQGLFLANLPRWSLAMLPNLHVVRECNQQEIVNCTCQGSFQSLDDEEDNSYNTGWTVFELPKVRRLNPPGPPVARFDPMTCLSRWASL